MPFPTITVKDGSNASQTVNTLPNAGQQTAAESLPVVLPASQIQSGSGVVTASTQRVTLATDGPGVANLSTIAMNTAVQFGAGTVSATTQRVTLASDGPTVTALTSIDGKTPALVGNNTDGEAVVATGLQPTETYPTVFNGTTWDRQRGSNGSINVVAPAALDTSFASVLAPPTSNLLSSTGTVQAQITPGGVYTLCVSIDNATLGATANTLASCTTVAFTGSNLAAAKVVAYTGTSPLVGQLLAGTGISPGAYVVSVSAGVSFTMNLPATASGTNTLNVTAGSFAGAFERSTNGSSWSSASVIPRTYSCDQAATSSFVAPGLFQFVAGDTDNFVRFNVTSVTSTGVLGNLSAGPRLRFDIDAFDRNAGCVNLPYVSYVAATAATFPTGIPVIMPVSCDGISEIDADLLLLTGTSQVVTWRQSNDENGVGFQGLSATTTHVAQNSAAITATAVGNYRIAPAARYFYAAMTTGTAVTANTINGVIARVGIQPSIQAVHVTTNNVPMNISQIAGNTTQTGGATGVLAIGGKDAHSAATTANPTPTGGRVVPTTAATVDLTLVAGDSAWTPMTTSNQKIIKAFGTAELDWSAINSLTPTVWASAATLTQVRAASGTASVRSYVSGLSLSTDALGGATSLWLVDGPVAIASATVATPGVFTSGTHDFKIGDAIVLQGIATLAVTGVAANQVVYVVTVPSTTTFTVALTPGGTGVQVTASGTATAYRILKQIRLQTTALPVTAVQLPSPIRSAPNVAISLLASATQTGTIYADTQGYYGF